MSVLVLGIDPGETSSGWAVALDHETVVVSGVAKNARQRANALVSAKAEAERRGLQLHVVIEWVTAGGGSMRVAMGIGQARGRWLEQVELELGVSKAQVAKPTPDQWRASTHGVVRAKGDRKEREAAYKCAACSFVGVSQPDQAEACCIALHRAAELAGEAA